MAKSKLPEMPEYGIWQAMKNRCRNPNVPHYGRYGGRGITVCDRWQHDFWAFYNDMGPRPGPEYSIDRIDNDGHYEPGNCRWVTASTQARNRSNSTLVPYQGRMVTLAELSELTGIKAGTLQFRLQAGFSPERLTSPSSNKFTYLGEEKTLSEWATTVGLPYDLLRNRLSRGWSVELTLTTPILKPTEYHNFNGIERGHSRGKSGIRKKNES